MLGQSLDSRLEEYKIDIFYLKIRGFLFWLRACWITRRRLKPLMYANPREIYFFIARLALIGEIGGSFPSIHMVLTDAKFVDT
jgi:hypothetical protein